MVPRPEKDGNPRDSKNGISNFVKLDDSVKFAKGSGIIYFINVGTLYTKPKLIAVFDGCGQFGNGHVSIKPSITGEANSIDFSSLLDWASTYDEQRDECRIASEQKKEPKSLHQFTTYMYESIVGNFKVSK